MGKCQRFENRNNAYNFCQKLDNEKSWLISSSYRPDENGEFVESIKNGLGLKKVVDNILDPHKVNLTPQEKENTKKGLEKLYKSNYPSNEIDKVLKREFKTTDINSVVDDIRIVKDENGDYHYVNKLNTNYSDLSELLTDLFIKDKSLYNELNGIEGNLREKLYQLRKKIHSSLKKYYEIEELKDYTNNSIINSDAGDKGEKEVSSFLSKIDSSFKEEFIGGDGNFVDMKFGVDLMMSHPKHKLVTIQVKPNDPQKYMSEDRYEHVDWIATYKDGIKIYDNKTKEDITDSLKDTSEDDIIESFIKTGKI